MLHSIVLDHIGLVDMWVYDIQADKHSHEAALGRLRYAEVLQNLVLLDFGSVG